MNYATQHVKNQIHTERELRKVIPDYPKMLDKRLLDSLDQYCLEFISHSRLVVSAFSEPELPMGMISADSIEVVDSQTISFKLNEAEKQPSSGSKLSLFFMVAGVGHALRVNGIVRRENKVLSLQLKMAYLHCSRAAARAELWSSEKQPSQQNEPVDCVGFIKSSPFLLLKTMDESGNTEISPRGDGAGFVSALSEESLFIPERPGNKVAVSIRNMLKNPNVEILFFVPGRYRILQLSARARISSDASLLALSTVNKKVPKLGILLENCQFHFMTSEVLKRDAIWDESRWVEPKNLTSFSKALSAHLNGEGLKGAMMSPVINLVVKNDLKNLY